MRKFYLCKNRGKKSGQSLAELAVFGSLMLMVLGWLLRYGMQYNYEQQAKMEAFRRALQLAYESDISKSQSVVLVKDVHIPNPQDMFTQGDRQPIKGYADVFWGANNSELSYDSTEQSPSVKYIFNPDKNFTKSGFVYTEKPGKPSAGDLIVEEYTTANLTDEMPGSVIANRNLILKGVNGAQMVGSGRARVYQQEEGISDKEVMILMDPNLDCNNVYCPKAILGEVELQRTAPFNSGLRYYPVKEVAGDAGEAPTFIQFLDSEAGELNSTWMAQQTENTVTTKHNRLVLGESSSLRNSTDILNETESVVHVIMTRDGPENPTFDFKNEITKPWTTPK